MRIAARRGVMLAAGGFDHNEDWRQKHHGIDGDPSGAPGNLGQVHALAARHGAALELMDDAWWGASVAPVGDHDPGFIVGERALPYTIMVDAQGRRFANEAESYVDLGHHMLEHDKDGAYWIISEARHARRYLRNYALDPRANKKLEEAGLLVKARTLAELADKAGFDPQVFREQIQRFNGFARSGVDGDFGKGNSAYDRYYGDPTVRPNPCLGPIEKSPFSAYRVVIGDLGTKGGVLTDEHARALREDGSVVEGLYAAGIGHGPHLPGAGLDDRAGLGVRPAGRPPHGRRRAGPGRLRLTRPVRPGARRAGPVPARRGPGRGMPWRVAPAPRRAGAPRRGPSSARA